MPPGIPTNPATLKGYKIKKTDSAATVPNRVTFPQGTFVNSPTSLAPRLPYQMSAGTQVSGLSGIQGVPQAMYPGHGSYPQPTYPSNYGYNTAQRGRGYGQTPNPNSSIYAPLGVPYSQLPRPGFAALPQLPSGVGTPATNTQALDPTQAYGGFTNTGGGAYADTAAAQYYAANGTPFTQQKRWDPQTKKFVSIGKLLKQGKLDLKGNWHKRSKRQKITNAVNRQRTQAQQAQQPAQLDNSTASAFVSFRA
jgi:hypothetical protein